MQETHVSHPGQTSLVMGRERKCPPSHNLQLPWWKLKIITMYCHSFNASTVWSSWENRNWAANRTLQHSKEQNRGGKKTGPDQTRLKGAAAHDDHCKASNEKPEAPNRTELNYTKLHSTKAQELFTCQSVKAGVCHHPKTQQLAISTPPPAHNAAAQPLPC